MRLRKLYEDSEVEVYQSLDVEDLGEAIIEVIQQAGRPLTWRELKTKFSAVAGEDRLRKVLVKLIEEDRIIEMPDGTFGLPGMERTYVPRNVRRVRPLVASKFYARWCGRAAEIRRLAAARSIPVEEAASLLGLAVEKPSEPEEEDLEDFDNL